MAFDTRPVSSEIRSCSRVAANCAACPSSRHCLVGGAAQNETARWNAAVQIQQSIPAGKSLYAVGDEVDAVYTVRAGCVKTYTVDDEGNERVRAFHLPGDIVGLDALGSGRHLSHAVAVTPAQICRVPREQMRKLLVESPTLMLRLVDRMSATLAAALALAGDYTADQRVAAFLVSMHQKLDPLPGAPARLPMCRRDIANFLRLATETVCRVLTRFEKQGLISTDDRAFRILRQDALRELAEPVGITAPAAPVRLAA
ncbi:MAG TPA: cyclic nucleotide-binding domain-containing protein [Nevskiaceae bacterium]|nr:cyclic nucleotide-binding domain-containing protein [Nevskiaceae bacterium]